MSSNLKSPAQTVDGTWSVKTRFEAINEDLETLEGTVYDIDSDIETMKNDITAVEKLANASVKTITASGTTITYTTNGGTSKNITTQDTTYDEATTDTAGLLSASDKAKLDSVVAGATAVTDSATNGNIVVRTASEVGYEESEIAVYEHPKCTAEATTTTAAPDFGETFTAVDSIKTDSTGHVTGVKTKTVNMPVADSNLSTESENPVQNAVVTSRLNSLDGGIEECIYKLSASGNVITYTKHDGQTTGTIELASTVWQEIYLSRWIYDAENNYVSVIDAEANTEHFTITNDTDTDYTQVQLNDERVYTFTPCALKAGAKYLCTITKQADTSVDGNDGVIRLEAALGETDSELETTVADLLERVAALEYEDVAITAFTASPTSFEVGTVATITFTWTVTGGSGDVTIKLGSTDVSGLTTTTKTVTTDSTTSIKYTLTATDGTTTATKTVTVYAYNYVYYGAAEEPDEYNKTFLTTLSKVLSGTRSRTFTASAGSGEYIYYAVPVSLGACTFTVGGFTGGFTLVDTVTITNGGGIDVDYYIYKSDNANLGSTSVTVS